LILYTLSKNVLPHKSTVGGKMFSRGVRFGFICLIALIVSKPIELLIYSSSVDKEILQFKVNKISRYNSITEAYYQADKADLECQIKKYLQLPSDIGGATVHIYREKLKQIKIQKNESIKAMQAKVLRSNYFILSISILNKKHPSCWLFTLSIIFSFLCPSVIKYFVSVTGNFYQFKKKIETNIILEEYATFKSSYTALLNKYSDSQLTFYEVHADPPFNTRRKKDPRFFKTENDLLSEIYNG
jgi:hypothetical protein